jgi:hypothetical protein
MRFQTQQADSEKIPECFSELGVLAKFFVERLAVMRFSLQGTGS